MPLKRQVGGEGEVPYMTGQVLLEYMLLTIPWLCAE